MNRAKSWCKNHNCTLIQTYKNGFAYMTSFGETYYMPYEEM